MCDLRLAGVSARFGLPDTDHGLSPTSGMTYLLTRTIGTARAMHLALTADVIDAEEANRIGLVTRVVEDAALLDEAGRLAQEIANRPRLGVAYTKRLFHSAWESTYANTLAMEKELQVACFRSEDTRKAFEAFATPKARPATNDKWMAGALPRSLT